MMRRMSKRFAVRAAATSSSSWRSAMTALLQEDDVQSDDQHDRAGAQQPRRAVPDVVGGVVLLGLLLVARQAPDEAAELLLWLGLRDQRDADGDDEVGDERDHRAPEALRQLRADVDRPPRRQLVRPERAQEARDQPPEPRPRRRSPPEHRDD